MNRSTFVAAILAAVLLPFGALAQSDWPNRPITFIVPYPPGGLNDAVARVFADRMTSELGRQVLVDNKAGAATTVASNFVAKAAPDGYTIYGGGTSLVINPTLTGNVQYDPHKSFDYVSLMSFTPFILQVNAEFPAKNMAELIAHVKANPRKFDYPTPGMGTVYHLTGEMLNAMAGIEMNPVPFRGGAEPINELLSGRMEMLMDALTNAYPYIQSGRFRPLAVSSLERSPVLPNVPTVTQSVPGYEATSFLGIAAPRATSPAVVKRLNAEIRRVLALPDIAQRFADMGGTPRPSSPAETERFVESEIAKWKRVVEMRKIELQ